MANITYKIYNEEGKVLQSQLEIPEDGYFTSKEYDRFYVKPYYNRVDDFFYEGATTDEIYNFMDEEYPVEVTKRQLSLQLVYDGYDLSSIDSVIDNLEEPTKTIAKIEWGMSTAYSRRHPLVMSISQMLDITPIELINIFKKASEL